MTEIRHAVSLLQFLASYLGSPKVQAVAFALFLFGGMIYVAISCRQHSRAQKKELSDKHDGPKRRHAVFPGERSL